MAIQDPKTFEEAVASATHLESLDRAKPTKVSLNLMGVKRKTKEDPIEGMVGMVEKLGVVLALIESAQWNRNPNCPKEQQNRQGTKGFSQAENSTQRSQAWAKTHKMAKGTGPAFRDAGKGSEQEKKKDYRGVLYKRTTYNPDKFCIAHQIYGHATDECSWLKSKLKDMPPPPSYASKGKACREVEQSGN